mmetsp:Transcript_8184/g.13250  ORF Transcript_8184/g.13250 Transcript_8184/m.13250 type:complete len:163 (+) Transcript_8184:812-1300(+)
MVPETGGCPCYYARRFFGKVYCKHEALLCLFLRKDPKALLPECSRPWIPSTVEMDGVREGSGNQPLCSVLTDSERMSVPAMPETSEASVSQHKAATGNSSEQGAAGLQTSNTPSMRARKPREPRQAPKPRTPAKKRGKPSVPTRKFEKRVRHEGLAAAEGET